MSFWTKHFLTSLDKLVTHDSCHHKHALGEFSVLCVVLPKSKSNDRLTTNDPGKWDSNFIQFSLKLADRTPLIL